MLLRYCLKVYTKERSNTYYIKAKCVSDAINKFAESHPTLDYHKIEQIGDALPAPEKTIQQLIKEAKTNSAKKRKRWVAAKKYGLKSGISVFAKPKI